jgi:RNA polymerase sigma factor (sigma-70 family)
MTEVDWRDLWRERPALLRLALRHSTSYEDAEDAVSDALLRAAESDGVERVGPWMTRVTVNLCHDAARERARAPKRLAYARGLAGCQETLDERVCDRDAARSVARRVSDLPARQRNVVVLTAQGLSVGEVAEHMAVSYKTVESLLARARAAVRSRESAKEPRRASVEPVDGGQPRLRREGGSDGRC